MKFLPATNWIGTDVKLAQQEPGLVAIRYRLKLNVIVPMTLTGTLES